MNQAKIAQSLQKQYLAKDEAGGAAGVPLTVSAPTAVKYMFITQCSIVSLQNTRQIWNIKHSSFMSQQWTKLNFSGTYSVAIETKLLHFII